MSNPSRVNRNPDFSRSWCEWVQSPPSQGTEMNTQNKEHSVWSTWPSGSAGTSGIQYSQCASASVSQSESSNYPDQTKPTFFDNDFDSTDNNQFQFTANPMTTGNYKKVTKGLALGNSDMEVDERPLNTGMPLENTYKLFEEIEKLQMYVENSKSELEAYRQSEAMNKTATSRNDEDVSRQRMNGESNRLRNSEANIRKIAENLQNENEEIRKQLESLKDKDASRIKTADELGKTTENLRNEILRKEHENTELEQNYQKEKEKRETLLKEFTIEYNKSQDKNKSLEEQLSAKTSEYNQLVEKNRQVSSELSTCKTRLSKVMGNKLSDNNPEIADLSDKNRPTKLAEKFQEIYDNQWTDAFERVEQQVKDEQKSVEILKNLLMDIKRHSEAMSEQQKNALLESVGIKSNKDTESHVPDDIARQIKELRKASVELTVTYVYEQYFESAKSLWSAHVGNIATDVAVQPFIQSCVEICWMMLSQDPPLAFSPEPKPNQLFDTNKYKHYTKTGSYIHFVVWPALLLHEGGSLLAKGIAQALPDTDQRGKILFKGSVRKGGRNVAYSIATSTQGPPQDQQIERAETCQNNDIDNIAREVDSAATFPTSDVERSHGKVPAEQLANEMLNKLSKTSSASGQSHVQILTNTKPTMDELRSFKFVGRTYGFESENTKRCFGDRYKLLYDYITENNLFQN